MSKVGTILLLHNTRQLLNDPSSWIQGCYRRDAEGKGISVWSDKAVVARCLDAALSDAGGNESDLRDAKLALQKVTNSQLVRWNDRINRKHSQVLDAIDQAITLVRLGN